MTDEQQAALIAEQLGRLTDKITARLDAIEERLKFAKDLEAERNETLKTQLAQTQQAFEKAETAMKKQLEDHETRLRAVQDQTTGNKVLLGLTGGGSSLLSIAAFVKSILGGGP